MALKRQYAIRVVYLSNIVIAVSYCGGRYQKYVEENVSFFKIMLFAVLQEYCRQVFRVNVRQQTINQQELNFVKKFCSEQRPNFYPFIFFPLPTVG